MEDVRVIAHQVTFRANLLRREKSIIGLKTWGFGDGMDGNRRKIRPYFFKQGPRRRKSAHDELHAVA